ncbi:MAG: glycosyltransferase, partial [Phycisphaerales bacterium]|nr:glycosyltransferase [Phycisphaerales bacterium]
MIAVVCIYGLHRYYMVWAFLHRRDSASHATPKSQFLPTTLPRVTVQLPMFNERRVAERIITAACAIDYPRHLLQIQVLDDSTDQSAAITKACCERLASGSASSFGASRVSGSQCTTNNEQRTTNTPNIQYIHRNNRNGFKAGALANGLASATGEFIAVFDADFV